MEKVNIIKIIKEEVGGYNYIGLDEINDQEYDSQLLKSKDFQTQFVHDVVNNFKNTIKLGDVNTLRTNEEDLFQDGLDTDTKLNIEYDVNIIYNYLGKNMSFNIIFVGNNINYGTGGYYDKGTPREIPASGEAYYTYFDWDDINFEIYNENSGEIKFDWLRTNPKLYATFVKKFVEDVLTFDVKQRG